MQGLGEERSRFRAKLDEGTSGESLGSRVGTRPGMMGGSGRLFLAARCPPSRTLSAPVVVAQGLGVAPFDEFTRDTHTFKRRVGDLPVQKDGEAFDFRGLLHRDGTVYSAVNPNVRSRAWGVCMRDRVTLKAMFGGRTIHSSANPSMQLVVR